MFGSKVSTKMKDLKLKDLRYPNRPKTKEGPIFFGGGDVCELPLPGAPGLWRKNGCG